MKSPQKRFAKYLLLFIVFFITYADVQSQPSENYFFYRDNIRTELKPSYDELFITFKNENALNNWKLLFNKAGINKIFQNEAQIFKPAKSLRIILPKKFSSRQLAEDLIRRLKQINEVTQVHPSFIMNGSRWYIDSRMMMEIANSKSSQTAETFLAHLNTSRTETIDLGDKLQIIFETGKNHDPLTVANALHESRTVTFAQPVFTMTMQQDFIPNDPSYNSQWFLNQANDADIDAPEAWNVTNGSSSVKVAVIDGNGYDLSHPDMAGKYINPYDAVNIDNDPSPENSTANHGTPTAGLIGAATNNGVGVASVGFNVKVVPIVIGYNSQSNGTFNTDDNIISRAASHVVATAGIVAVSNSWAGSAFNSSWNSSFNSMYVNARSGLGAVILAATGNSGTLNATGYPASFSFVVGVGATDQSDTRASFSNYGLSLVDVSAPGVNTFTIDRTGAAGYSGNDYTSFSGTSAACPVAAGVVGLIASANPSFTKTQLESSLSIGCDKVGGYSYSTNSTYGTKSAELGYGRVNASAGLISNPNCPVPTINPAGYAVACPGDSITLTANNATAYSWSTGATTQSITVTAAGIYTVAASNPAPCPASNLSVNTSFRSIPNAPVVSPSGPLNFCQGGSVTLFTSQIAGVNYQWQKNGVDIPGATSAVYVASQPGSYKVKANYASTNPHTYTNSASAIIPDNNCSGALRTISVPGYNTSVNASSISVKINISHPHVGDLDIFLVAPNGQTLGLSNQTGNASNPGQNFVNTFFADSGTSQLPVTGAPYSGLYQPWPNTFTGCIQSGINTFADFGGGEIIPSGNWILRVYDRQSSNAGSIMNWSITFPAAGNSCYSVSNSMNVTVKPNPAITSFSPASSVPGALVTISGSAFTTATAVKFNGINSSFTINNDSQITATVPQTATTGPITVINNCSSVISSSSVTINAYADVVIKAFIQGFYSGDEMTTALLNSGAGNDTSVTDSVTVLLLQSASPFIVDTIIETVLYTDGTIAFQLPAAKTGNSYFVSIKSRTALETWSKIPLTIGQNTTLDLSGAGFQGNILRKKLPSR